MAYGNKSLSKKLFFFLKNDD